MFHVAHSGPPNTTVGHRTRRGILISRRRVNINTHILQIHFVHMHMFRTANDHGIWCLNIYKFFFTHVLIHTYAYTCAYTYICVYLHANTHRHRHRTHTSYIYIYIHIYIYIYIYITHTHTHTHNMNVHVCVCVCVYTTPGP
jgi:hypothetical protein